MTILIPYSYNGTSLQSTDYETSIPRAFAKSQIDANVGYTKRAGAVPVMAGKDYQPISMPLEIKCLHDYSTLFATLNQLFSTRDETPRQLICTDSDNANKQYYVYATAKRSQAGHDGQMYTVDLAIDDPIWQSVTQNSQAFAVTSATDSTSVTNGGNADTYPIFEISPTSQASTDYIYTQYLQILPQSSYAWNNRFLDVVGTTDGTGLDTAALVAAGKIQSDGDDLRVFRDGVEIDRQLSGMNTTDTHIIVTTFMPAKAELTLKTAIASTDTVTEIVLNYTTANKTALSGMPNAGRVILDSAIGSTDSEEFTYTARTITDTKLSLTVNARSVRGTTASTFAANANVRYLPYDFSLLYGNATATAPTIDETRKPIESLTSRNTSFIYTNYGDEAGLRSGIWDQALQVYGNSNMTGWKHYTSTNDTGDTDPFTAMGLNATPSEYTRTGNRIGYTNALLVWQKYFMDGITSISASGDISQTVYNVPTIKMEGIPSGGALYTLFTVSPQASTDYDTWTTWTKATTDSTVASNTIGLRWGVTGSLKGTADDYLKVELSSLTVNLANPPHIKIRGEASNSKIDITIHNDTTGESFQVVTTLKLNDILYIDTDPDFPTCKYNGIVSNGAVKLSTVRSAWLKMSPGANTIGITNNLSVSNNFTVTIKWRDRLNFF